MALFGRECLQMFPNVSKVWNLNNAVESPQRLLRGTRRTGFAGRIAITVIRLHVACQEQVKLKHLNILKSIGKSKLECRFRMSNLKGLECLTWQHQQR